MKTLNIDEVLELVRSTPEKAVFDWKSDFAVPNDDEARGEFLKDLAAVANACVSSYGFVVYGVDPRKPDPVLGISGSYDDAKLQQFVKNKIQPYPQFLYYEVSAGPKTLGVLQVQPTRLRPYIISVDLGKVRRGQIVIRRGSSTDGVTMKDLFEFFYSESSGYFPGVIQRLKVSAKQRMADTEYLRQLQEGANQSLRDMEIVTGVPRGSLGAKW